MQQLLDSQAKIRRGIGVGCFVMGLALVAMLPLSDAAEPFCPLRRWLGLPCLLCGGTRATQALLHGQWDRAFYLNPWTTLAVILAGLWAVSTALEMISSRRLLPSIRWTLWRFAGLFAVLLLCWGFQIWSALSTPKPELLYDRNVANGLRVWIKETSRNGT